MISSWLSRTSKLNFTIYALIAAFGVYFCMYAFRKPFTAASFENKEMLVISQVIGYLISKFYGIKFVSELSGQQRGWVIVYLILFAELVLVAFAYLPDGWRPYDVVLLLLNGLPLGVIWGIVFSYLEGRKFTEILAAGLTVSFILSSGFVKSVGKSLILNSWATPYEMPYITGLVFMPLLVLFVLMLIQVPPPDHSDKQLRTERIPMDRARRQAFFMKYATGLVLLILAYMLFTAYRDIRENFANEIWLELGVKDPAIFTKTELPVGLVIGLILAWCFRIRDNMVAFRYYHYLVLLGLVLILLATVAFSVALIGPVTWMTLLGIGTYMAYVTFASVMFDRLVGASGETPGNAGFMIYVVDSMGYLGSVVIMLYKFLVEPQINWLAFFLNSTYIVAIVGIIFTTLSMSYFSSRLQRKKELILSNEEI